MVDGFFNAEPHHLENENLIGVSASQTRPTTDYCRGNPLIGTIYDEQQNVYHIIVAHPMEYLPVSGKEQRLEVIFCIIEDYNAARACQTDYYL